MKAPLLAAPFLLAGIALALAQGTDHSAGHDAGHGASATTSEADARSAFEAANAAMHENMAVQLTGDADIDFARSMIPHHQGAIDMARIVLEHGDDPEMRALAEEIVEAQEAEIAVMREWLEKNAPDAGAPAQ